VPESIESRLLRGTRRELGEANTIALEVAENPSLAKELIDACSSEYDPLKMRAFDALEKALRTNRALDTSQTRDVLLSGLTHDWWEVRIQCIRGISLCKWKNPKSVAIQVTPILQDSAKFVRAWAMDTAVQLACQDHDLIPWAEDAIQMGLHSGIPSLIKRSQKSSKDLP